MLSVLVLHRRKHIVILYRTIKDYDYSAVDVLTEYFIKYQIIVCKN